MTSEHIDVLIVGAGISGIGAAYHLQEKCPGRSYAILESRADLGGTWDLFRYPGIRSDSDMYTLGYQFKPWLAAKAIADGPNILEYLHETADEHDIKKHIRFNQKVLGAAWSSADKCWTVSVESDGLSVQYRCNFLFLCSGYYNYAAGYTPDFDGMNDFSGAVVHPQHWPEDIDIAGKKVIVIGSGATAVTLLPELAKEAEHVVMLQRSPTYMVAAPSVDPLAVSLRKFFAEGVVYRLMRWRNVWLGMFIFWYMRRNPERSKSKLISMLKGHLGEDYDVETHFTPHYKPWDQRICLVPDGDLFKSISDGRASVVTGHIDTFTENGLRLQSGEELDADLIVTATGLDMRLGGGIDLSVDGQTVELSEKLSYRGMALSEVPNMVFSMGYTNASWTLKVDLTCDYVCRLLNYMDSHGYQQCTPRPDATIAPEDMLSFTSGYVKRALATLPKQGSRRPWKLYQNYVLDKLTLGFGSVADKWLEFK